MWDINTLRGIVTVLSLAVFIGIVWWAFSRRNKKRFEKDALLPFEGDEVERKDHGK